ncbi:gliding motility-associated ABC transporter substrate-binding protein GldG [Algivirga pacifica]|uniref:Gldg family protein n=1 Tax=Algivirga pacifica TaxID=1162670 RepID=A0ABP9DEL2_9BACT
MSNKKWEDLLAFSALVLTAVLLNMHAHRWIVRWDLTEEKRFTMRQATQQMLEELPQEASIEVYLDGEMNADFKRLQEGIRETLEQFRMHSAGKLSYRFVDPNATKGREKQELITYLVNSGIPQTNLFDITESGERIQKMIFPGAIIRYAGKEKGVLLLKGNKGSSAQEQINQSIEGIEYELASTLHTLTATDKKRIAFIQGHGELTPEETQGIAAEIRETYLLDYVPILPPEKMKEYDAIVVAQPKTTFSPSDKFFLDQYLMQGGKAILMADPIQMNKDSIPMGGTYGFGYDLRWEELIFRYGIRLNTNLVQDQQAGVLEVVTGNVGNQQQVQPLPWPYYIYLNKFGKHPIVRNLDVVYGKFVTTLDTVKTKEIKKTPLMFSSQYSRIKQMPGMVSLDEIRRDRDKELFDQSHLPVAYLLEGAFTSLYANRYPPLGLTDRKVIGKSPQTKLIVVGDADIIRNERNWRTGKLDPIDFDPYRQQRLSNTEFFMNSLAYLTDDSGLISARSRQVTLRPLDPFKVTEDKLFWQLLNIAGPVMLVIIFGIGRTYWRRKQYGQRRH